MPTPSFPKYGPRSLRPNPTVGLIDPERDSINFVTGGVPEGDFGGEDASATRTVGLPKPEKAANE